MKYWEIIADKLTLLAGRGVIAAPLPETAGAGSLTRTKETVNATLSNLTSCSAHSWSWKKLAVLAKNLTE